MSGIVTVVGGYYLASESQKDAAESAASAQVSAAEQGSAATLEATQLAIDETRRQFDAIQELLSPYISAGETALTQQMNLAGLGGASAQEAAIAAIEGSPQYESLVSAGEEAILQNAAATGGLRGGNVQAALAEYRPSILSQLIESQYSKLGGITGLGQASAVGQASLGSTSSSSIANMLQQSGVTQAGLYSNIGNAIAQQQLASGQATASMYQNLANIPLQLTGMALGAAF